MFSTAPGLSTGGTVGQPDAGRLVGGPYGLTGGFWAVTVPRTRCGDVNGDGTVNIGDALVVAQFDVGLRPCDQLAHPEACDVNLDGACNIGDALKIAQCDVGLISCTFTCNPILCP